VSQIFKVFQIAARKATETLYFNVHGELPNVVARHPTNGSMNKKLKDWYFKGPAMRAFLRGVEKRDEKVIFGALKVSELEAKTWVIKKATRDRYVLFVASGKLLGFPDKGGDIFYEEGAILGIE